MDVVRRRRQMQSYGRTDDGHFIIIFAHAMYFREIPASHSPHTCLSLSMYLTRTEGIVRMPIELL